MGKKRSRQPDLVEDGSEESSESYDGNKGKKCTHVGQAINKNEIRKIIKKNGIERECATCEKDNKITPQILEEGFEPCPPSMWMCLQCGNQACSQSDRNHAIEHYKVPRTGSHSIAIDTFEWRIWCYECSKFINADQCPKLSTTVAELKKMSSANAEKTSLKAAKKDLVPLEKGKQKVLFGLTKVVGLINLGNTCFMNAVLQCLAQTPFLVKVLEDMQKPGQTFVLSGGKYKNSTSSDEIILPPIEGALEHPCQFTQVLQKTLTDMQNANGQDTYKPNELLNAFRKKSTQCMDGGQHDSHEFLRHLLELVRGEDLRRYQTVILKNLDLWKSKSNDEDKIAKLKFYGHQASARLLGPEPVFKGILVSTIECLECHHSSSRTEPFLDLSLPVMADKPQPPVFKRKSSGFEDAFDLMNSNSSNSANKTPRNRETKRIAKKELKYLKNRQFSNSQLNNTPEDNNDSAEGENSKIEKTGEYSASGSESDVEDNAESGTDPVFKSQEILESGYSSEKPSAVASPVSPENSQDVKNIDLSLNSCNDRLSLVPSTNNDDNHEKSPTDVNSTTMELNFENTVENKGNSFKIYNDESSIDLVSPDGLTANLISSSNNSVENPSSPVEKEVNDEKKIVEENTQVLYNRIYGPETESESKKNSLPEKKEDYSNTNGIGKITTGMTKMTINHSNQPLSRYVTCEREFSIQSCLNQFTAQELMAGNNVVGCEACTAKENKGKENSKMVCTPSTKQYLISQVPAVLILHLKRFQSHRIGFSKLTRQVNFPMILDLAPVCKNHNKPKIYSLYGVVEHSGTLYGGHYVAYVKARQPLSPTDPRWSFLPTQVSVDAEKLTNNISESTEDTNVSNIEPPPGRWYYISDSRVSEVDENTVLKTQAYLLFYERIL